MSEVELLREYLSKKDVPEAKLLLELLDSDKVFSDDVKTMVKSLVERGDFKLLVELFEPVLQKRSDEVLSKLRDLPLPLMLYIMSLVLVELSPAVEKLGDMYFYLHCEMLRTLAKKRGVQLSAFGAFGRSCIQTLLANKRF